MADLISMKELIEETNSYDNAWIFKENGNGKLRNDVIVGDVIPLLKELSDFECDKEDLKAFDVDAFLKDDKTENFYSYNQAANISHDVSVWYRPDSPYGLLCVHLYGDAARGGFSDFVPLKFDTDNALENIFNLDSVIQTIPIDEDYAAELNIFSDTYKVYDRDGNYVCNCYQTEKKDALEVIREATAEKEEERE